MVNSTRETDLIAHALMNLLNNESKRDQMWDLLSIYHYFAKSFKNHL